MARPSPLRGWPAVGALVLGLTAALAVLLVAFAWPPTQMAPRGVPLVLAGPAEATGQVETALAGQAGPGAFEITGVQSRDVAVAAIEAREAYGAVVLSAAGPELLVASAAGPVVAQMLTQVGTGLAEASGTAPVVTDVVPLPEGDPRGAVFGAGALPLVIGGMAVGMALALRLAGRLFRLVAGAGAAVAAGSALAGIQQYWLGALTGSYWANAGVYALAIAAMAAAVVGLHTAFGLAGAGVGAATILLLGNPLSGITSAPELLPEGWSTLGQLLPPGAAGTALRSVAFFDGAGAGVPLLVLTAWLVGGVALAALPSRRRAARPAAQVTTAAPAT